jgi:hypothetical protein
VLADESLEQQIEETLARHQAEPRNADFARKLGALYALKEDLENAVAWYQCAADLANNSDTGVAQKISDLLRKRSSAEQPPQGGATGALNAEPGRYRS